jgi:MFS family permease
MALTILFSTIVTFGLWLPLSSVPMGHSLPLLYIFATLFGFGSGSAISLAPVCFGQLCKANDYGRYYGTGYIPVSFAYVSLFKPHCGSNNPSSN